MIVCLKMGILEVWQMPFTDDVRYNSRGYTR